MGSICGYEALEEGEEAATAPGTIGMWPFIAGTLTGGALVAGGVAGGYAMAGGFTEGKYPGHVTETITETP